MVNDNATYQIRVRELLDEHWMRWFDGFQLTFDPNGDSILTARGIDQAALHSALNRIRDLGLELICVQQIVYKEEWNDDDSTKRNE